MAVGGWIERTEKRGVVWPRPYELLGSHFAAVRSFWFERDVGREREREPSLTVTQHYAAGQDGGGERHKMGGDEEREEIQDGEVGEGFPIFSRHGLPVCHIMP